ncbi:DUF5132 domain-containing protein [Streptomyces sp. ST1015]|nr:DUF5132 domain-containing protein [Streptomyces sp. ST1015]
MPLIAPFLLGIVAAPIAKRVVKPLVQGTIKTSVGLAMDLRKAVHEVGEGFQDMAAEVTAEVMSKELSETEKAGLAVRQ